MSEQTFHFTLGPVQGFVAQARRTRDFWAGSFLLSWLAGAAMLAVEKQGGKIEFPKAAEGALDWLQGQGRGQSQGRDGPRQGSIPNRFKAIQCKVPEDFDPDQVTESVRKAWTALAEAVWRLDMANRDLSDVSATRAIWQRQINGFWEISWVLGEDSNLLDRRKNWRSHLPPEEPGVNCSVMVGWQELSGAAHPGDPALNAFWAQFRDAYPRDFDEAERLCAIAFVKRRFVAAFAELREPMPNGWTLHGWGLQGQMPSTLDLAAAHWVARLQDADQEVLKRLHALSTLLLDGSDHGLKLVRCVRETGNPLLQGLHSSALFPHVLENRKLCPDRELVQAVQRVLKDLKDQGQMQSTPPPFYAILLMDGDSLGKLLQDEDTNTPSKISEALNDFTGKVPELVDEHNGFLIYAGGDDVLALLPLEDALGCATAVRAAYLAAFKKAFGTTDSPSTLSAAITFTHVKIPLTRLLRDSHHLLDAIAKDATGRDALAVRVVKQSGEALQWARPWECAWSDEQPGRLAIERLAERFSANAAHDTNGESADYSSKFFYRIRERFQFLNPSRYPAAKPPQQDQAEFSFSQEQAISLLAVDYLASGVNRARTLTLAQAKTLIQPLVTQCYPVQRCQDGEHSPPDGILLPQPAASAKAHFYQQPRLEADGALLVRFLAHKGAERA